MTSKFTFGALNEENEMSDAEALQRYGHLLTPKEKKDIEIWRDELIGQEKVFKRWEEGDLQKIFIEYWVNFLRCNESYSAYCKAQREKDIDMIEDLNRKFPDPSKGIAQIYKDFGDIYLNSINFDCWFDQRRHLFFSQEEITLCKGFQLPSEADQVVVSIPKGVKTLNEFRLMLTAFWDKDYQPNHSSYEPKYKINCDLTIDNLVKIHKFMMVESLFGDMENNDPEWLYSDAEIVAVFMFNPVLRYAYALGPEWQRDAEECEPYWNLPKSSKLRLGLSDIAIGNKKPHIVGLRKIYDRCVSSTVLGTFPVLT